jgi:hypothetical protein
MTVSPAGGLTYIARMAPHDRSFRFLSNDEFVALPDKDKVTYLLKASQALEERQRHIRDQMRRFSDQIRSENQTTAASPSRATLRAA